jgi:hypothetical protein
MDAEYSAVVTVKEMAVATAEEFIFGYQGASFWKARERGGLILQFIDELRRRVSAIGCDKSPDLLDILFGIPGDLNLKPCGHS